MMTVYIITDGKIKSATGRSESRGRTILKFIPRNWVGLDCVEPIPVTERSMVWICGRSLDRIVDLNPARDKDVCLLRVLCAIR